MSHSETTHPQGPTVPATPTEEKKEKQLSELDEQALTLVTGGLRSNGYGKP